MKQFTRALCLSLFMLSVCTLGFENDEIIDYVTTSGTTGNPIFFGLTDNDLNRLAYNEAISFCNFLFSYSNFILSPFKFFYNLINLNFLFNTFHFNFKDSDFYFENQLLITQSSNFIIYMNYFLKLIFLFFYLIILLLLSILYFSILNSLFYPF